MANHTPFPWRINDSATAIYDAGDYFVVNDDYMTVDNALFIVKACNHHEELVAALKLVDGRYRLLLSKQQCFPDAPDEAALDAVQAALSRVQS